MRGRTNAEPNIGVQLNASIDSYEIYTGESILAGDFVDRFTLVEGGISASTDAIFHLSDGKYLIGTNLYIDNGDHTFTEYGESGLTNSQKPRYQIDTDEFIAFNLNTSNGKIDIVFIKYNSSGSYCVARSATYTFEASWAHLNSSVYAVQLANKKFIVFISYIGKNNNSRYGNAWQEVEFNITGNDYSDYTYSTSIIYSLNLPSSTSVPNHECILWATPVQNYDYIVGIATTSNLTQDYYVSGVSRVYRFTGSSSATRTSATGISGVKYISPLGSSTGGYVSFIERSAEKLYSRLIFADPNDATVCSAFNPVYLADLKEYNSATNQSKASAYQIDTDRVGYNRYIVIMYVSQRYTIAVEAYVNISNRTVEIGEQSILTEHSSMSLQYILDTAFYYTRASEDFLITTDSLLYEIEINNHVVEGEIDTNKYIKSITTLNYVLGVAKQTGTAGDTIEVYVPSTSY